MEMHLQDVVYGEKMLSETGKDYICTNFGSNDCCVATGLSWTYYIGTDSYPETGGTAQIVARLASGLIDYLETGGQNYTKADLDSANGSPVTLQDAQEIANHDEPSEGQWCVGDYPDPPNWLLYAGIGVVAVAAIGLAVALKKR